MAAAGLGCPCRASPGGLGHPESSRDTPVRSVPELVKRCEGLGGSSWELLMCQDTSEGFLAERTPGLQICSWRQGEGGTFGQPGDGRVLPAPCPGQPVRLTARGPGQAPFPHGAGPLLRPVPELSALSAWR